MFQRLLLIAAIGALLTIAGNCSRDTAKQPGDSGQAAGTKDSSTARSTGPFTLDVPVSGRTTIPATRYFRTQTDWVDYELSVVELSDDTIGVVARAWYSNEDVGVFYSGRAVATAGDPEMIEDDRGEMIPMRQFIVSRGSSWFQVLLGKDDRGVGWARCASADTSAADKLSGPGLLGELHMPECPLSASTRGARAVLSMGISDYLTLALVSRSCEQIGLPGGNGLLFAVISDRAGQSVGVTCLGVSGVVGLCPYSGSESNTSEECDGTALFFDNAIQVDTSAGCVRIDDDLFLPAFPDGDYRLHAVLCDTAAGMHVESETVNLSVRGGKWTFEPRPPKVFAAQMPPSGVYREVWQESEAQRVVNDCRCESRALVVDGDSALFGSFCSAPVGQGEADMQRLAVSHAQGRADGVTVLMVGGYPAEYVPGKVRSVRMLIEGEVRTFLHASDPGFSVEEQDCDDYQG